MKSSVLHLNVMASAILWTNLFHYEGALADGCPVPSFAAARMFDAGGAGSWSVAAGDFNGDGKPDLAVANYGQPFSSPPIEGNLSVLLGNGDGTFQAAVNYGAGAKRSSVAVGDFNGDGKADLAVANSGTNNISVLVGNGDGTFQAAVNYSVGDGPQSVAVGDFNGDGKPDLAAATSAG